MDTIEPTEYDIVLEANPRRTRALVHTLNDLIAACLDSRHMFRAASEDTNEPQLRDLYLWHANTRDQFVQDLAAMVRDADGKPQTHETVAGSLLRSWMDLQAGFLFRHEYAVLAACEAAEDRTKCAYERALRHTLDIEVERRLRAHHELLKAAHLQLRALGDLHRSC